MLGGMVLLPLMDGLAKLLSETYPVLQVVWARYLFHLLVLLPLLLRRYRPAELVPDSAGLQLLRGALLAGGAGLVHGFYMIFTRRLSGSAPPLVTLGYTAVVGAVAMSVLMPFIWVTPTWGDLLIMMLLGVFAAGGHYLLIRAFDHAPATFLAPLGYAEMVTAILIGWFAYGQLPDLLSWLGIAVIIAAGVAVSIWEGRLERRGTLDAFPPD